MTLVSLAVLAVSSWTPASADSLNSIAGIATVLDRSGKKELDHSDIVVFLDGANVLEQTEATPKIMSHKGRRFSPRVFPVVKGTTIDFLNDDSIYHNVFSLSVAKPFDLGIYAQGASRLLTFDEPALIRIYCNLHPDMMSTILVLNNGFFAKTDADGRYELSGIPDGEYTLRLWYEFGEEQSRSVSLTGSTRLEENFTVDTTKRRRKHKNKFGKPYRQKY